MLIEIESILKQSTRVFCVEDFAIPLFVKLLHFFLGDFFNPGNFTLNYHNNGVQLILLYTSQCVYKYDSSDPYNHTKEDKLCGQPIYCQHWGKLEGILVHT